MAKAKQKLKPVKAWAACSRHWGIFPGYLWATRRHAQNYVTENLDNATDHVWVVRVIVSQA